MWWTYWWWLIAGQFVQAVLEFWWSLTLLFCIHNAEGRKKSLSTCTSLSVYIYIYSAPSHIPHEQDCGSILHDWNTLPQSTHLHTEEYRSEKCHEKVKTCQNYLKKQKMSCGAGLTVYWVMVLVNLYKLLYMTMFDSCGSSIIKIKVCFALLLLFFLIHRQDECQGFSFFHGPNVPILIMISCQRLFFNRFSSVKSLSCVQLFATPWTARHQASLYITNRVKINMKGFFFLILIYLYLLGHCKVRCLNWCLKSFMWCVKRPICIKEKRSAIILLQAHLV